MAKRQKTRGLETTVEDEHLIQDLQGLIWSWHKTVRLSTFAKLADVAYLSPSTIANIASGKTKRPQHRTVMAILEACGYRYAVVAASVKVEGEIVLSKFRRTIPKEYRKQK